MWSGDGGRQATRGGGHGGVAGHRRAIGEQPERHRRGQWLLLAGFLVFAAIVVGLAYWAWAQQARSITAEAERSLNAVARLKAGQITAWTTERRSDAELLSNDTLLSAATSDLLAGRDVAASRAHVRSYLDAVRKTYGYVDGVLVAPDGRVLVRVPPAATHPLGPRVRALVAEAERTGEVVSSDLYLGADGVARIELAAPILARRPGDPPVATVVMHVDPDSLPLPLHPGLAAAERLRRDAVWSRGREIGSSSQRAAPPEGHRAEAVHPGEHDGTAGGHGRARHEGHRRGRRLPRRAGDGGHRSRRWPPTGMSSPRSTRARCSTRYASAAG